MAISASLRVETIKRKYQRKVRQAMLLRQAGTMNIAEYLRPRKARATPFAELLERARARVLVGHGAKHRVEGQAVELRVRESLRTPRN